MITLITGQPGMGKTSLMVSLIEKEAVNRPVYVFGITDLDQNQIPHFMCPPVDQWTEKRVSKEDSSVLLDYFTFPPNSILVIDEAQRIYRPRSTSSKVPPHVAALETHRHTGLDIYLITQGVHLLDSNVKDLIGKHMDIRPTIIGRYLYEWQYCGDPKSKTSRGEATRRRFSPPKSSFGKYKSAEFHTQQSFRLNYRFVIAPLLVAFIGYNGYGLYSKYRTKYDESTNSIISADNVKPTSDLLPDSLPNTVPVQQVIPPLQNQSSNVDNLSYLESHLPEVPSLPHTAPIYRQVTKPDNVPYPAACVISRSKGCICYTDQATKLLIEDAVCRQIVSNGFFMEWDKKNTRPTVKANSHTPSTSSDFSYSIDPATGIDPVSPSNL